MLRLKAYMVLLIANEAPLAAAWPDHNLKGDWSDHRECRIGGDSLLIYQVESQRMNFARAGTH
jgi:mRNA interferase YafQ